MFNEETYEFLKKSYFYKRLTLYFVIGASAVFFIGVAFILIGTLMLDGYPVLILDIVGALFMLFPVFVIIKRQVKPYMCTIGKIKAKSKNYAIVAVGDEFIKATSFEHFLKNKSLKDYEEGDKVVIYSADKRITQALFYHVNWLT